MAAVNEVLTAGGTSSVFTPTVSVSDVSIEPAGSCVLQSMVPSGAWEPVTDQTGAFSVVTADAAITYRFVAGDNVAGNMRVYMGP